jgi:hypothetical protein
MRARMVKVVAMLPIVAFMYWYGDGVRYSPSFPTMVQCNRGIDELGRIETGAIAIAQCVDYSKKLPPFNPDAAQQQPASGSGQQGQERKD